MTDNNHPGGIEQTLSLQLDHASDVPLYRQIVDRIWLDVIEGGLEPGTRLPTIRQLSVELGVNPRSVERAYRELELLGVLSAEAGSGTYVCLRPPDSPELRRREQLSQLCRETVSRGQNLGFSIDELADGLRDVPPDRGSNKRGGREHDSSGFER